MGAAGLIGAAVVQSLGLASEVQTTIVTQDREWATSLAQELRDHHLPTLTPASPARWREHFDQERANCVIFDLDHGSDGVFDAIAQIRNQAAHTMIVAAASSPSIKIVVNAMRAGAIDFVNKRHPVQETREQIREAAARAREQEVAQVAGNAHRTRIDALSAREREVLRLLAAGLATKQIAHRMELSPRTVEMFRRRIRQRLEANSIAEAISIWMSHRDQPELLAVA
ncbi:response regulator transcription factor [Sphingomonas colocasiae]|uniref:LuxR C-terminal-related transcriptional regulator n=1 Tax=Sphingomonas colocasiae TaxID=1848973 RepID=A0ABS7PSX7_9SPHN|nr:LuxR C-terminal-related transcriptional regulator [Sphingomonas colocasiae]MBY8824450.1 LuxR C-terminal-related transcriptional regulator [Sphingomonas colocasiae]